MRVLKGSTWKLDPLAVAFGVPDRGFRPQGFGKTLGSAELGLTTLTFCRDLERHVCLKMPPRLVANRRLKRSTRLVTPLFSSGFAPAPLSSVVTPFSSGFTPSSSCSSGQLKARKALERCIPSVAGCGCGCGFNTLFDYSNPNTST